MAKRDINIGTEGNDGTGDSIRESFRKVNENFNELYAVFGAGGTINFTTLSDTPDDYSLTIDGDSQAGNFLFFVDSNQQGISYRKLASDNALNSNIENSIQISYDEDGYIILSSAFGSLFDDQTPELGGPLNASGRAIMNAAQPDDARIGGAGDPLKSWNDEYTPAGADLKTVDEMLINKGYADRRYVPSGIPLRVDDEPIDATSYVLEVQSYTSGNIVVPGHGYDSTINGTAFIFDSEDVDPPNLVSGTTYYLRYETSTQLGIFPTRLDATAGSNKIYINPFDLSSDVHTFTDAGYNSDLTGFYLEDQAIPRKSIVRRQGDTMTGPLVLHDSPGELAGLAAGDEELQAATKFYVDNTAYSSQTNLFVSTGGDDTMKGVPKGKEGTAWSYAYRTINAAAVRAEEIIKASEPELGPYAQFIYINDGADTAKIQSAEVDTPVYTTARDLMLGNVDYVVKEIIGYLNWRFPDFEYDTATYERDTELLLKSVAFDVARGPADPTQNGANSLSRLAGEKYYATAAGKVTIDRQKTQTLATMVTADDMIADILVNQLYRQKPVAGITNSTIATVTTGTFHELNKNAEGNVDNTNPNQVIFKDVSGMTELNDNIYFVKVTGDTTFELYTDRDFQFPVNSVGFGSWTSGGRIGVRYQTDNSQYFDNNNADDVAATRIATNFKLVRDIINEGIDTGAATRYGNNVVITINDGAGEQSDQLNPGNVDVLPGKLVEGVDSGAKGRIVSVDSSDSNNDVIRVHQLNPVDFIDGEELKYGNFVKTRQITILIESGTYEEDYPIKVPANVSVVGDEFRRVIIRPKKRISQSKWANTYFYRDLEFDGITLVDKGIRFYNQAGEIQGRFGRHYLTDASKDVYVGSDVTLLGNPGKQTIAANTLAENKTFITNELISFINANYQKLLWDINVDAVTDEWEREQFRTDFEELLTGITFDITLNTNYNQVTQGLKFQRASSRYLNPQLRELWIEALETVRDAASALPALAGSGGSVARARSNAAFNEIIDIIQNGVLSTSTSANALTFDDSESTPNVDDEQRYAKNQLILHKQFIIDDVTAFIANTDPRLEYNSTKCQRDVGYIIDALCYDIMFGGNTAIREVAIAYFEGAVSQLGLNQKETTSAAYTHLQSIVGQVIKGAAITPQVGNSTTYNPAADPNYGTAAEETIADNGLDLLIDRINKDTLTGLPSGNPPDLTGHTSGAPAALLDAKIAIDNGASTLIDAGMDAMDLIAVLPDVNFATQARRDLSKIIDALSQDLVNGGDEFATEVQGLLRDNIFAGSNNLTENAIRYIPSIAKRLFAASYATTSASDLSWDVGIWQSLGNVNYVGPDLQFGVAETGTGTVIDSLVEKMIATFSTRYNPPKRNDELDVFMMNDATILRNMTVQGHGGFMCILDPEGQILTKSPYIQTGSSFSKSINRKHFAGGLFCDGYVGNLPITIKNKINNLQLEIESDTGQGLAIREPQLPCPFYIDGRRYQVNAIDQYDGDNGTAIIFLDAKSNDGAGYDESQFLENPGQVERPTALQTAGNRSILGNDFTQMNDLGYGLVTNNTGISEMVSMFTYYCQAAYYAKNGSEIRSLNGSNGYGNFGLIAEGADPNEIPRQVTLRDNMTRPARTITFDDKGSTTNTEASGTNLYVADMPVPPTTNSIVTIDHPTQGTLNYRISAIKTMAVDGYRLTGVEAVDSVATQAALTAGTYDGVTATGGSGSGAEFTVQINGSGAVTLTITDSGIGYSASDVLTIDKDDIGGTGVDITTNVTTVIGGTIIPSFNNDIYRLQISGSVNGTNGDFFNALKEDVPNNTLIEFRDDKNFIFTGQSIDQDGIKARPSTAINFDESDEVTYRSISFATNDDVGNTFEGYEILTTTDASYDTIDVLIDNAAKVASSDAEFSGTLGDTAGDMQVAIDIDSTEASITASDLQRFTRDLAGNSPTAYDAPNAFLLVQNNIRYTNLEVLKFIDTTYPTFDYDKGQWSQDLSRIVSAVSKDLMFGGNANIIHMTKEYFLGNVSLVESSQKGQLVVALQKAKEIVSGYVLTKTSWTTTNTDSVTQYTTGNNAEAGATTDANTLFDIIIDAVNNETLSGLPTESGYQGGMIFSWAGKTHQIINYEEVTATYGVLTLADTGINLSDRDNAGIASEIIDNREIKVALPEGTTAEITVNISLLRATGHDFTGIGEGGFNTANYPNVILGPADVDTLATYHTDEPTADTGQVWERRKGRVFWASTDQYGFFRVGKYFSVDQAQGSIAFSGEIGITNATELAFQKGVSVSEFSVDETMADASPEAVPTELAVVSYINKRLGRTEGNVDVPTKLGPGFLDLDGAASMKGNLSMGTNKITGLAVPDDGTDAANKSFVDNAVSKFDNVASLRDTQFNRLIDTVQGDLLIATGLRKIFTTIPAGGVFTSAGTSYFYDTSLEKKAEIYDVQSTTDPILGDADGNLYIITYKLAEIDDGNGGTVTSEDFNGGETIRNQAGSITATIKSGRDPVDELAHAREADDSIINWELTRAKGIEETSPAPTDPVAELDLTIRNDSIIDADINSDARILQSKLMMDRAGTRENSDSLFGINGVNNAGQGERGLAVFDADNFIEEFQITFSANTTLTAGDILYQLDGSTLIAKGVVVNSITNNDVAIVRTSDTFVATNYTLQRATFVNGVEQTPTTLTGVVVSTILPSGFIGLKEQSLTYNKFLPIATNSVIGRTTPGTGEPEVVSFDTIVDEGFALQDKDFTQSNLTLTTGIIITLVNEATIADDIILRQDVTGNNDFSAGNANNIITGKVQGSVFSEKKVVVTNLAWQGTNGATPTFVTGEDISASGSGTVYGEVAVVSGETQLLGEALIKVSDTVYGTLAIDNESGSDTIVRRTTDGSIQATSYILGGESDQVVLSESGSTLTFSTPSGGTILTSNGSNTAEQNARGSTVSGSEWVPAVYPRVDVPGSAQIGDTQIWTAITRDGAGAVTSISLQNAITSEGSVQAATEQLGGVGFTSTPWTYTNIIQSVDTHGEGTAITAIALGAPAGIDNAATDTIVFMTNGSPAATLNTAELTLDGVGLEIYSGATKYFGVDHTNGNTTVGGTLSAGGNTTVDGTLSATGNFDIGAVSDRKFSVTASSGNTQIDGTLTVDSSASFKGTVSLGDAAADTISINGKVGTNIVPSTTGKNLGSASDKWNTVYAGTFDGTALTAQYADLAEKYVGDEAYEPGTVVVFGGEQEVTLTSAKGDHRVAGVVSTNPALLMNKDLTGDTVVDVALQGRVPCKVVGRVQKGDILVSSAIPGYACVNNNPSVGTIIGKAVGEKLDDTKGIVEVVVGKN